MTIKTPYVKSLVLVYLTSDDTISLEKYLTRLDRQVELKGGVKRDRRGSEKPEHTMTKEGTRERIKIKNKKRKKL